MILELYDITHILLVVGQKSKFLENKWRPLYYCLKLN